MGDYEDEDCSDNLDDQQVDSDVSFVAESHFNLDWIYNRVVLPGEQSGHAQQGEQRSTRNLLEEINKKETTKIRKSER